MFFGSFFGPVLGHVLDNFFVFLGTHFWTISAQDGPRLAQEGHQELQRIENLHLQKSLKNKFVFRFLGSKADQDSLRKPKKAPKRHQKSSRTSKKQESQNGPKFYYFFDKLLDHFGINFWTKICLKTGQPN